MEKPSYSAEDLQEITQVLKPYGHTWNSFQNVQKYLAKSHQYHYTRNDIGALHTNLEKFRNTKGVELWQRSLKKSFFRQEDTPEEQGFLSIDDTKGDRVFLNELLLKYARQANDTLFEILVTPRLKPPAKNKKRPAAFHIPPEVDTILLMTHPLACFTLLNEVKAYQQRLQHQTRWLYVEVFINRWFFKFNRYALFFQKNLGAALYRLFFRKTVLLQEVGHLSEFLTQTLAEHLGEAPLPLYQESQNNLRTAYLLLLHLLLFLLEKQGKLPIELYRIFTEFDNGRFYARKDYVLAGMRADYEKWHPLPNLARKVSSRKEQALLADLGKKRFHGFWQHYSHFPTYVAKLDYLSSFTEVDRLFILGQFYQQGHVLELAKLHEHAEKILNTPEEMPAKDRAHIGSQRSKFLRSLWQIVNKHQLTENTNFSQNPEVVKYVQAQFGGQKAETVEASEFVIDPSERRKGRKKDWRQLSMHEIPPYTKVKKWSQIARLPFDIPDNPSILFSFMPYVRINEKRLEDRLTIAHCVELIRLPFRYLVSNIETRLKLHFITIGDLLLMQILGPTAQSSHSLFRFLFDSKQIGEPKMVDLLKKVYPVIELQLGELLREHIPYVINHRYAYKGGGINGINAGIAIERINEMEDQSSIYLSAGKMFHRAAEAILMQSLFQLEPQFVEESLTVEKPQLEAYLAQAPLEIFFEKCLQQNKNHNFDAFLKWWQNLAGAEKETWRSQFTEEIFLQRDMFFHDYPNPYILPTS